MMNLQPFELLRGLQYATENVPIDKAIQHSSGESIPAVPQIRRQTMALVCGRHESMIVSKEVSLTLRYWQL